MISAVHILNHNLNDHLATPDPEQSLSETTLNLAASDIRTVSQQQHDQANALTTKLNILFVVNGAFLTSLSISRLIYVPNVFSFLEILGFLINFCLLINAFLPRQVLISPNLEDNKFLERYLTLSPDQYQLQMMVNLVQIYNANKKRLDDISQGLIYAAYSTLIIAVCIMLHILVTYFVPVITLK
jgi:hypothetical protein